MRAALIAPIALRRRRVARPLALAVLLSLGASGQASAQPRTPTTAVLSADASVVAAQERGTIRVWDRGSGKLLTRIKSSGFFRGAVAPGALVAVVDGGITVWRGPRFGQAVKLRGVPRALSMGRALVSADGRIAVGQYPRNGGVGDPDTVGVWDARSGASRGAVTLEQGRVLGVALSRDGRLAALFGDVPGAAARLRVCDLSGRAPRELWRWESARLRTTYSAAFSADGKLLALGAGERVLLWDVPARRLRGEASTAAIKALFPPELRGASVQLPGAHQLVFSPDGRQLATLHAFGVVGVALWRVGRPGSARAPLQPAAWIKRPETGGTMRQLGYDRGGRLWLITATYSPNVWVHAPRGDRFVEERTLTP
jgi:hypothetical protein